VRDWRSVNLLFLASTILDSFAMGHLVAFTPLHLVVLGLSPSEVTFWTGMLYATMMAVAFPLAPFWGALGLRFSRRAVIVRSHYLAAAAFAITAFAPDVWWLVVARLVLGFTFGNVATLIATQVLLTPTRHVGTAIATIQTAQPVAASFGPPLGAALIGLIGVRNLFLLDAFASLAAALLVTFLMPEPASPDRTVSVLARTRETAKLVWQEPALRWNFASWFLGHGGRSIVDAYLPVRIAQVAAEPAAAIGWIMGVYGALTAASTWITGRMVDERGGVRWLVPSMVVAAASTVGVALAWNIWVIGACAIARSFPSAAYNTFLYGHLARALPQRHQTTVMAITPVPRNISGFVMPLIASIVTPLGVGAALAVGAASYAGVAVTASLLQRAPALGADRPS
jgi:DHA1 family multidrug resistance protein-like MFS transporter